MKHLIVVIVSIFIVASVGIYIYYDKASAPDPVAEREQLIATLMVKVKQDTPKKLSKEEITSLMARVRSN